jgi:hypothetical protein
VVNADFQAWREKGRKIGRQLLGELDVMALEDAIRAAGSRSTEAAGRRSVEQTHAYTAGLQEVLREHRRGAKRT